jgi:hypothetical protein
MQVNLIIFQHFDHKPAQWKPKPSFEEASINHNFVFESSLVGFGGLDDNPIKGLTSVLSVE